MKIVVLDGKSLNHDDLSWESLKLLGDVTIFEDTPRDMIVEHAKDADILLTNKTPLKEKHFAELPKLKYIGITATGFNIVDVNAAKDRDIVVTNVPSYGTYAVAQFVFAHLLEICHQISKHAQSVREGNWNRSELYCYWNHPLIELYGKTMGIIGTGRIGMQTANLAQAFGMKVIAYAPRPQLSYESDTFKYVDIDTLYKQSDVISLHCPLNDETRGIVDEKAFEKMKKGVIIINTSRGPLIDEPSLIKALKNEKVYAAGLDVLSQEPPNDPNPLFEMKQCNVTPHIAWAPRETRERLLDIAVDNLRSYLEGQVVNSVY